MRRFKVGRLACIAVAIGALTFSRADDPQPVSIDAYGPALDSLLQHLYGSGIVLWLILVCQIIQTVVLVSREVTGMRGVAGE